MLEESKFWKFIALINWQQKESKKILQPIIKALADTDEYAINQFSESLAFYFARVK